MHAEQNALLSAARFGIATESSVLYSTMRPCFGCSKELLQAKVKAVYFLHDWVSPDTERQQSYLDLQSHISGGIYGMSSEDDEAVWAVSSLRG